MYKKNSVNSGMLKANFCVATFGLVSSLMVFSQNTANAAAFDIDGTPYTTSVNSRVNLSSTEYTSIGTLFGPNLPGSGVAYNVDIRQLSTTSGIVTGVVNGQSVSCNFTKISRNSFSTSGSCGILSSVFSPTDTQQQEKARAVVQTQVNRTATQQTISMIERRISSSLAPQLLNSFGDKKKTQTSENNGAPSYNFDNGVLGLSSGNGEMTKGLWATYSHGWIRTDWDAIRSHGNIDTGVVGGDIKLNDNYLVGMTLTYQASNIMTGYNDGYLESRGVNFVPYVAVALMDGRIILDAMTGYGFGGSDIKRNRTLSRISGAYDSDRWMMSTNATYVQPIDRFTLSGKVGWMMAYEWGGAYTEDAGARIDSQVTRVGEVSIGGRAAYAVTDVFEPYLGATFNYDPILGPSKMSSVGGGADKSFDRKEVMALIGFNWTPVENVTTGLELTRSFFREKQSSTTAAASLRVLF
ncbi:exported hypothetical protein [Azospirillaceae bacterium]